MIKYQALHSLSNFSYVGMLHIIYMYIYKTVYSSYFLLFAASSSILFDQYNPLDKSVSIMIKYQALHSFSNLSYIGMLLTLYRDAQELKSD